MGLSSRFAAGRLNGPMFQTEAQVLSIGPKQYIGLPGEPFVELGLQVQQQLGPDDTYVIGFANDDPRYILPQAAYENNRYETWGSLVAPGSGETLIEAAEQVAHKIKPS